MGQQDEDEQGGAEAGSCDGHTDGLTEAGDGCVDDPVLDEDRAGSEGEGDKDRVMAQQQSGQDRGC